MPTLERKKDSDKQPNSTPWGKRKEQTKPKFRRWIISMLKTTKHFERSLKRGK